jgi:hypothetical protein
VEGALMANNVTPKSRRIKGGFLMIPHEVLKSRAYRSLPPSAVKLLVDIAGQYNGRNNGDLAAYMKLMRPKGWHSTSTLHRAKQELLKAGLIEQTRQGGMNLGPNLYAVTWKPIDDCEDGKGKPRHDATPTSRPSGLWKQPRDAA